MLYSIHTNALILKEMEERNDRILDADYSKVDLSTMVADLDITEASKQKLQTTLEKFLELFGGRLGCLTKQAPSTIKLVDGAKPFAGQYYNLPRVYNKHPAKKEVE